MAPAPVVRAAAAAGSTPAAVVRTAAKAHPLTPSRQVVLEEEQVGGWVVTRYGVLKDGQGRAQWGGLPLDACVCCCAKRLRLPASLLPLQDYIMQVEKAAAAAAELAVDDTDMASVGEPSPLPAAAAQPRLMSKVVVPSPGVYDPRQASHLLHLKAGLPPLALCGHPQHCCCCSPLLLLQPTAAELPLPRPALLHSLRSRPSAGLCAS